MRLWGMMSYRLVGLVWDKLRQSKNWFGTNLGSIQNLSITRLGAKRRQPSLPQPVGGEESWMAQLSTNVSGFQILNHTDVWREVGNPPYDK